MIFQQSRKLVLACGHHQTVERCLVQFGKCVIGRREYGEWPSPRQGFAKASSGYGGDECRYLRIALRQCDDILVHSGFGGSHIVRCHGIVFYDFGFGWRGFASTTCRQSQRRQADGPC